MKIQIDPHTIKRAKKRGATEAEIIDVIESGSLFTVKYGRKGKSKVFSFKANRRGKRYDQKKVEVIFIQVDEKIITVTVKVLYGKWE